MPPCCLDNRQGRMVRALQNVHQTSEKVLRGCVAVLSQANKLIITNTNF